MAQNPTESGGNSTPTWKIPIGFEVEYLVLADDPSNSTSKNKPIEFKDFGYKQTDAVLNPIETLAEHGLTAHTSTLSIGSWLVNGGRIYKEGGQLHTTEGSEQYNTLLLEYASPEMLSPSQASWHFGAISRILSNVAQNNKTLLIGSTTQYGSKISAGFHENYGFNISLNDQESIFNAIAQHLITRVVLIGDGGYDYASNKVISQRGYVTSSECNSFSVDPTHRGMYKHNKKNGKTIDRLEIVCGDIPTDERQAQIQIGSTQLVIALAQSGQLPELSAELTQQNAFDRSFSLQDYSSTPNEEYINTALTYQEQLITASKQFITKTKIPEPYLSSYKSTIYLWEESIQQVRDFLEGKSVDKPIAGWIDHHQQGTTRLFDTSTLKPSDPQIFNPPNETRASVRGTLLSASAHLETLCNQQYIPTTKRPHIVIAHRTGWEQIKYSVELNGETLMSGSSSMDPVATNYKDANEILKEINSVLPKNLKLPKDLNKQAPIRAQDLLTNGRNPDIGPLGFS